MPIPGNFVDFRRAAPEVNWGGGGPVGNQLSSAPGDDGAMLRKVCNLEVEDFHTYHVGTRGLWACHGDCQNIF